MPSSTVPARVRAPRRRATSPGGWSCRRSSAPPGRRCGSRRARRPRDRGCRRRELLVRHGDTLLLSRARSSPDGSRNSQSMALRRRRYLALAERDRADCRGWAGRARGARARAGLARPGGARRTCATAADWEAAAAAVLRKARRLSDDDADDLVWDKLTRTTLDGIEVTPLGTPDLLDGLETERPADAAGRLGRPGVRRRSSRPKLANEEALVDLDGGVTSPVAARRTPTPTSDALLDRVLLDLAPVVLDGADPAAGGRAVRSRAASSTPAPTSASRPPTRTAETASWPALADARSAASSSTPPRSTTAAPRTPRSSATVDGRGRDVPPHPDRRRPRASTRPRAWSSSATPPPTSSSRRSPSCAPPAGSGPGCSS